MTKKEITQHLTTAMVDFYCDYLDAREGDYTEETKKEFYHDMRTAITAIAYAAKLLGVQVPKLDQIYRLAYVKLQQQAS